MDITQASDTQLKALAFDLQRELQVAMNELVNRSAKAKLDKVAADAAQPAK